MNQIAFLVCGALLQLKPVRPRTHDRVSRQKPARNLLGFFFFAEETGRVYIFRRGNCRGSRQAKKRACLLFPRREWRNLPCRVPRQPNKELDEENDVFRPSSSSVVCTWLNGSFANNYPREKTYYSLGGE